MLDNQLYLLLIDGMHLKGVRLYQDEYYFDETYQGETITKTVIIQELQTSIAQGKATPAIENYGFGAKRFMIPPTIWGLIFLMICCITPKALIATMTATTH